MKLSYVLVCALALNSALGTISVVSKADKSALENPSSVQMSGKNAILENSDIAKSLLNLSGFSMERKGGGRSETYYRSQTAGRLPVLIDGSTINGGLWYENGYANHLHRGTKL